jgi:tRNA threonylcarbamoyl adenosine modification protein YjeE
MSEIVLPRSDSAPPDFLIHSLDEEGVVAFAQDLATRIHGGDVLLLEGPLGAGKTFFTRAFGHALGISSALSSPTYVLHCIHEARDDLLLHHLDFYRLSPAEADGLGLEEFLDEKAVMVIEWPDRCPSAIGEFSLRLRFEIRDSTHRAVSGWWGTLPFDRSGIPETAL